MRKKPDPTKPDVALGIAYWQSIPATVDGVLGGYGLGTLPRVDALGSRSFLLGVLPRLSAIPPVTEDPVAWQKAQMEKRGGKGMTRTRALDCGAGVGRVTESVLLRVVEEVHVAEPVEHVSGRDDEAVGSSSSCPVADLYLSILATAVPSRSAPPLPSLAFPYAPTIQAAIQCS